MVKNNSTKKVTKKSKVASKTVRKSTTVDYYPNKVALLVSTVAVMTLLVLGLLATI
ncbi:hypothetical protein KC945_02385 [Candidatus Saccharibacteria bacterium]|nr:hypothetical protein [Candidatus Saccharibacteria bacterium]